MTFEHVINKALARGVFQGLGSRNIFCCEATRGSRERLEHRTSNSELRTSKEGRGAAVASRADIMVGTGVAGCGVHGVTRPTIEGLDVWLKSPFFAGPVFIPLQPPFPGSLITWVSNGPTGWFQPGGKMDRKCLQPFQTGYDRLTKSC
jgi:hypothetical protein